MLTCMSGKFWVGSPPGLWVLQVALSRLSLLDDPEHLMLYIRTWVRAHTSGASLSPCISIENVLLLQHGNPRHGQRSSELLHTICRYPRSMVSSCANHTIGHTSV